MKRFIALFAVTLLAGCASSHDFVEGSKILGSMLWNASANKHTECTYVDGHGNVCYQVRDNPVGALTPEQEAEIEAQVLTDIAAEQAAQEKPSTI